jgi:hypothetical protein
MKKRNGILSVLVPVLLMIALYVVFSSRIKTDPGDAGFWLLIAMGMSLGVALTRIIELSRTKGKDN